MAPSEAFAKFEQWANNEQGLGPLLSFGGSTKLTASYTPFWYFDVNVRFIAQRTNSLATPSPFRLAYPNSPNGVIHIPGLAAYAGFSYRRSLIDPVHNTTPVFMKKDIVPFGQWMLEPLKYNNEEIDVFPDPWNATRERAFSVIFDELESMANEQYQYDDIVTVENERLSSRRIYLPTYIVEYTILGISYKAMISGCDASMQVSGVSHNTIFSSRSSVDKAVNGASSFLSNLPQKMGTTAAGVLQMFGLRPFVAVAQFGITILSRIAMKLHIVAPFIGAFMAYRKLFRPYIDARNQTAEWERQREYEQQSDTFHQDSFRDTGTAKAFFKRNKKSILSTLSGEEGRQHGSYESNEWYSQWEEWARQQFERAQRESSRAQKEWMRQQQTQGQGRTYKQYEEARQQQQQQRQSQRKQAKKDDDFKWEFDESDPFSVLGVSRSATKDEVSKAFRREMLKHHPDLVGKNASEQEKRRATERSKIISDAYRKIKSSFKK